MNFDPHIEQLTLLAAVTLQKHLYPLSSLSAGFSAYAFDAIADAVCRIASSAPEKE